MDRLRKPMAPGSICGMPWHGMYRVLYTFDE